MDFALLINRYAEQHGHHQWPRQRLLHECLRAAIRDGTLVAGARLAATRVLAEELGVARNTVLYAYEQLASEGFVSSDRRGTVVAAVVAPVARPVRRHAAAPEIGLAQRARDLRVVPDDASRMGAFVPGVPALDQFPLPLWRRMLERALRGMTAARWPQRVAPAWQWLASMSMKTASRPRRMTGCSAHQD